MRIHDTIGGCISELFQSPVASYQEAR